MPTPFANLQKRLLAAGLVASVALICTLAGSTYANDAPSLSAFSGQVKILQWDPKTWTGSFKHKRNYYAFQLADTTRIRKDKPVLAGSWRVLNKEATTVWCLAEKAYYQSADRTVGRIKPRLVLCAGFGMEPVPNGERQFPGIIGILGWHSASDMDWKKNGTGSVAGELFDMGTNPKEIVMFGVQGHTDDVKKGLSVHVLGPVTGTHPLTASGKILSREDAERARGTVLDAPLINVERIVVLHKAFKKVYPLCFEETFMLGAKN